MTRPLVAVTGRRLGERRATWPYARAAALPRAYLDAVRRAGADPVVLDAAPLTRDDAKALVEYMKALRAPTN